MRSLAFRRFYASVSSTGREHTQSLPDLILASLSDRPQTALRDLVHQYSQRSGSILPSPLPYESRPTAHRRPTFGSDAPVVAVVHCVQDRTGRHKMTASSGFALAAGDPQKETLFLSCAHTLEEIRRSPLLKDDEQTSGSFIVSGTSPSTLSVTPVSSIVSSIPRSDILVMRTAPSGVPTLPVSPYPAHRDTPIRAHFVTHEQPREPGWTPWVSGTWAKWVRGSIVGYRDSAGREAHPGTYDSLSHLLFSPLPTSGSSGGPIVEEESGAVVGVIVGTRLDNRVQGLQGWGVPAETIFEMFSLPGLGSRY